LQTGTDEKEFNLLYEPWILVRSKTNEIKKWSILEVFKQAEEVQGLSGELPTQDFAVMRLLLAIMHATFIDENVEDEEDAIQLWQEIWKLKKFPYEMIEQYVKKYEDRFWLFHPQYPFYQIADFEETINKFRIKRGKAAKEKEKVKSVARLIGDLFQSAHAIRLFSARTGEQQRVLEYDEAARWLLHLNSFDDDAAKNPTPKGVGYLGQLGLVYAQGKNLFETLMLNFVLMDNNNKIFDDHKEEAHAYWEKPVCKIVENLIIQPNAQKDLLTMQSRKILLVRERGKVIGYLLTMGDYFDKNLGLFNEQMTLWKKDDEGNYVPKLHVPERQIWRDLAAIICDKAGNEREAGIIHWLKKLKERNCLESKLVKICLSGISYKLKGAGWQVVDFINDSLQFNAGILGNFNQQWSSGIKQVLANTDAAVLSLGWLASDLLAARGNGSDKSPMIKKARTIAREKGYHQLDGAFRKWLQDIDPQFDTIETKMSEWQGIAKKIILMEGEGLLDECSNQALVGRITRNKDEDINSNAFTAFNKFRVSINTKLGKEVKHNEGA
jgi:CRISPR system Cascade subunit CasA